MGQRQAENAAIADYENNLIENVINSIERHGGRDCLSSIILTGSFGRGEPTYVFDNKGNFKLKSDVEIALVYPRSAKKKIIDKLISDVSAEFAEDLNLMGINECRVRKAYNFNYSIRVPQYKTIFTYDLFNGSKTIWGEDYISTISIRLSDVDPYEAKRLVANRIGEYVYLQKHEADPDRRAELRIQWKGKIMLAIASAWLICNKAYVSSYHGQYNVIKAKTNAVTMQIGSDFMSDYEQTFLFLRENEQPFEVTDEALKSYVKNINHIFTEKKISNPKVNSFSRLAKYYVKYTKTGMKYGHIGFEDQILQALITDFYLINQQIEKDAEIWHEVLY